MNDRGANRCNDCNKFAKWEDLRVDEFIPDTYFSAEYTSYICKKCLKNAQLVKDVFEKEYLKLLDNGEYY